LDREASFYLAEILGELKNLGHTLIIAEHRLSCLMEAADRIVDPEQGRLAAEWS
jgi:energy-coupling factor transport system ATP-binding protein